MSPLFHFFRCFARYFICVFPVGNLQKSLLELFAPKRMPIGGLNFGRGSSVFLLNVPLVTHRQNFNTRSTVPRHDSYMDQRDTLDDSQCLLS